MINVMIPEYDVISLTEFIFFALMENKRAVASVKEMLSTMRMLKMHVVPELEVRARNLSKSPYAAALGLRVLDYEAIADCVALREAEGKLSSKKMSSEMGAALVIHAAATRKQWLVDTLHIEYGYDHKYWVSNLLMALLMVARKTVAEGGGRIL